MDQDRSFEHEGDRYDPPTDSGHAGGKPSLDSLATETQLQVLRYILRAPIIELSPLDGYSSHKFGLGSSGILRVSKHFSALALGVLYGENTFYAEASHFDIQREAEVAKVKEVYGHIEPVSSAQDHNQDCESIC